METDSKNSKDSIPYKGNPPEVFGKLFLVIYKDDKGKTRTKILILKGSDNSMFYFTNPKDGKSEILPKKAIKRMAEQDKPGHTTYTGNDCQDQYKQEFQNEPFMDERLAKDRPIKGIIPIVPKEEIDKAKWRIIDPKEPNEIYHKTKRLL